MTAMTGGFDVGATFDPNEQSGTGINPNFVSGDEVSMGDTEQPAYDPTAALLQLPVMQYDEFKNVQQNYGMTFATPTAPDLTSNVRDNVVNYAKTFVGTPYVWGGSRPGGFDCSGLVQFVTGKYGLHLPRVSSAQAGAGTSVGHDLSRLSPGDLVVMDGGDHIAIYAGNGQIVEAPHTGARVRVRALGKNEGYWGVHLTYPGDHAAGGNVVPLNTAPAQHAPVGKLNDNTAANAQTIVKVGRAMGASPRDIQIALMTAWTESKMQTGAVGDGGEAIGLFQQHPSWGNNRTNAAASAQAFYKVLLQQQNRNKLQPWQVAQAVQRSAFADGSNYAVNWTQGRAFYSQYGG